MDEEAYIISGFFNVYRLCCWNYRMVPLEGHSEDEGVS